MHNKARPEGFIAEAYVATKSVIFCSMYLDDIEIRFNRTDRNADHEWGDNEPTLSIFKQTVRPIGARKFEFMDVNELSKAHFYILNNYEEIEDFIKYHLTILFNDQKFFFINVKLKIIIFYSEHKSILYRKNNTDADDRHRRKFAK